MDASGYEALVDGVRRAIRLKRPYQFWISAYGADGQPLMMIERRRSTLRKRVRALGPLPRIFSSYGVLHVRGRDDLVLSYEGRLSRKHVHRLLKAIVYVVHRKRGDDTDLTLAQRAEYRKATRKIGTLLLQAEIVTQDEFDARSEAARSTPSSSSTEASESPNTVTGTVDPRELQDRATELLDQIEDLLGTDDPVTSALFETYRRASRALAEGRPEHSQELFETLLTDGRAQVTANLDAQHERLSHTLHEELERPEQLPDGGPGLDGFEAHRLTAAKKILTEARAAKNTRPRSLWRAIDELDALSEGEIIDLPLTETELEELDTEAFDRLLDAEIDQAELDDLTESLEAAQRLWEELGTPDGGPGCPDQHADRILPWMERAKEAREIRHVDALHTLLHEEIWWRLLRAKRRFWVSEEPHWRTVRSEAAHLLDIHMGRIDITAPVRTRPPMRMGLSDELKAFTLPDDSLVDFLMHRIQHREDLSPWTLRGALDALREYRAALDDSAYKLRELDPQLVPVYPTMIQAVEQLVYLYSYDTDAEADTDDATPPKTRG